MGIFTSHHPFRLIKNCKSSHVNSKEKSEGEELFKDEFSMFLLFLMETSCNFRIQKWWPLQAYNVNFNILCWLIRSHILDLFLSQPLFVHQGLTAHFLNAWHLFIFPSTVTISKLNSYNNRMLYLSSMIICLFQWAGVLTKQRFQRQRVGFSTESVSEGLVQVCSTAAPSQEPWWIW